MAIDVNELLLLPDRERQALADLLRASLSDEPDFELTDQEWAEFESDLEDYRRDPASAVALRDLIREQLSSSR